MSDRPSREDLEAAEAASVDANAVLRALSSRVDEMGPRRGVFFLSALLGGLTGALLARVGVDATRAALEACAADLEEVEAEAETPPPGAVLQ